MPKVKSKAKNKMQVQIKKTIKAGNSSAVVLPRAWLNQEVRVELVKKTKEQILCDVLEIVKKHIKLSNIIGVYLVGSYARGEETKESDIDILIITNDLDKEMINEGVYNILIVSYQLLYQKLNQKLFPIGQMIKEAKPLLNADYIDSIEVKITKKNVKWYIDTTEDKLNIIKKYIDETKNKKICRSNRIVYTLVLRIRTLHIIKKMIKEQDYSNKQFTKIIKSISKNAYGGYLAIKNNLNKEQKISIEEVENLYGYLKKDFKEIKKYFK